MCDNQVFHKLIMAATASVEIVMPKGEVIISKNDSDKVPIKNELNNDNTIEDELTCHICNEEFQSSEFDLHFTTHQGNPDGQIKQERAQEGLKNFTCEFCDRLFNQATDYRTHVRNLHSTQSAEKDKIIQCEICMKNYKTTQISRHMKYTHGNL